MQPERFGRYEVVGVLGDGAMGRVYLARDPIVGREVAVKTVKAEYLRHDSAREFVARFRREAEAAGALNHPSIVSVFDVGENYIVMERLVGRTLQQLIADEGQIPPERAIALLAPIADALDHAHAAGIVHRDIKPANVMVQTSGIPKLMDFGVAHVEDSVLTVTGQILGSPSYMSPEQVAGLEVTARSDVYSLAVVAYEMLTGQSPFPGPTITAVIYKVLHDPAPPPRRWNTELPPRYDDVFARALAKEPPARFATARDLASALDVREFELSLDDALGAPAPGAGSPPGGSAHEPVPPGEAETVILPAPRGRRPRGGLLAGLLAAAALVVALLGLVVARSTARAPVPPLPEQEPTPSATAPAGEEPTPAPETPEAASSKPRAPEPTRTPPPAPAAERARARSGDDDGLVSFGPGVTPPRRVKGAPASYPDAARRHRLTGTVTVTMIVTETGEVEEPTVTESAGHILDAAVLDAVRGWRFEPARKDGRPVRIRWTIRQTYRLE